MNEPPQPPPAPTVPPSVDPATLPEAARGLATLPTLLAAERVVSVKRQEDVVDFRPQRSPRRSATFAKDASGSWLCLEQEGGEARCVTLPGAPDDVYLPATHTYDQDVIVSWRAEGDERIEVRIDHSGAARAVRGAPEGFPERGTPMPELARRPVPALLAGLRGLDVAISEGTGELAARSDRWLTFCDTGAPRACLPPVEVAALGHAQGRLGRLFFRGDGTHEIGFQWSETGSGGALDSGSLALVLSGRDRPSLLVLATVHTQGSRTTRTSVGLEGTYHSTESTRWYAGCLLVAGTTVSRDLTTNTSERRLPSPRLSRAPDVVPATGVDPMAVSLDGHWILQEEGGLRRQSGRCPGERPEDSRQIPFH